jgi:hypothetical protein
MKKMILILALVFVFVSCGGEDEKETTTDSDTATVDNNSNDSAATTDDANEVPDEEAEEEVIDFPAENNTISFKINGVDAPILADKLVDPNRTKAYYIPNIDEMFINYDSLSTENYAIGFGLYEYKASSMLGDWEYYSEASGSREGELTVNLMNRSTETEPRGRYGMGYFCPDAWANEEFKVTITEYSGVGGKIAGTFSGTLIDDDCENTVNITDGSFAIRRIEDDE